MNEVLLHDPLAGSWLRFERPAAILSAGQADEIGPLFRELDRAVEQRGLYAAGFVAYEAAPGFDPALPVRAEESFPLAWFGLYERPERLADGEVFSAVDVTPCYPEWTASVDRETYDAAIAAIKNDIARGHTYQVNYTYRLEAAFAGDPLAYFLQLAGAQRAPYAAFVNLERYSLCSASPELFFSLDGARIESKPMKGTARRGLTQSEDQAQAGWLRRSEKDRAENVMIVDMVRNDLGKIARVGSVQAPELFAVEKYPTVWQMVSRVTAETAAPLSEIFAALFPPASITGAPKPRTMQIIAGLETRPRRIYTGSIGYASPHGRALFNVAIRTALIDREAGRVEYGVGGGITWDSLDTAEYEECRTKARILYEHWPAFSLLETLLWTAGEGYFLLELHLERLFNSAAYFDCPLDLDEARACLAEAARCFAASDHRVRLLVDERGRVKVESAPLPPADPDRLLNVGLAAQPVNSADPFLYHKTTHRNVYEPARLAMHGTGWDDVLLWNERGELTESTVANLIVALDGRLYTPPVSSGLLAGTYRAWLLSRGEVEERVLRLEDLRAAQAVYLANSLRGLRRIGHGFS
jgi:para-aminobenzoate synthetase/4-amino-4-deoxychorismate lyase